MENNFASCIRISFYVAFSPNKHSPSRDFYFTKNMLKLTIKYEILPDADFIKF